MRISAVTSFHISRSLKIRSTGFVVAVGSVLAISLPASAGDNAHTVLTHGANNTRTTTVLSAHQLEVFMSSVMRLPHSFKIHQAKTSAPTTTVAAPTTTVAAPTTTVAAPTTTVAAPTTTVAAPTATVARKVTTTTSTSTTIATPAKVLNTSSAVSISDSKTTCLYAGSSTWSAILASAESATGVNYNCVETFSDQDPQWSNWINPWVTNSFGFSQWLAAAPNRTVILTQNLVPDSVANSQSPITWEQACASGAFNSYATQLAQNLVSTGFASSVIRLGHEMNGNWYNDSLNGTSSSAPTSAEESAWAACFAQEVKSMRAVTGAHFLFDWNVNACANSVPLASFYPGAAYVDIIGIDQYDAFCNGTQPVASASAFQSLLSPNSLTSTNNIIAFAKQQGKPISIPEWGLEPISSSGLGDDPYYVQGIASLVANNDVAYSSYFDSGTSGILQLGSATPNATAAYTSAFG